MILQRIFPCRRVRCAVWSMDRPPSSQRNFQKEASRDARFVVRPAKPVPFQPFVPQAEVVVVPVEDFDRILLPVVESEQVAGQRVCPSARPPGWPRCRWACACRWRLEPGDPDPAIDRYDRGSRTSYNRPMLASSKSGSISSTRSGPRRRRNGGPGPPQQVG
jgi:hypothetical protein